MDENLNKNFWIHKIQKALPNFDETFQKITLTCHKIEMRLEMEKLSP